jgi:hypothetical protein
MQCTLLWSTILGRFSRDPFEPGAWHRDSAEQAGDDP